MEEVGQSLQGRVCFSLRARLQHGNNLDCPIGTFFARRRWMGIYAVAPLMRRPDKHGPTLLSPFCGIAEGRSTPKIDRVYLSQSRELSQSIKMYLLE
jgi:hypothetical protein